MKSTKVAWIMALCLPLLCGLFAEKARAADEVVTYPAPREKSLLSDDYTVEVNGQPVDVYRAEVNHHPIEDRDYGGDYSFVQFDFSGTVQVKIHADRNLKNAIIRPISKGIEHDPGDENTTVITLKQPRRLSFEPNGEEKPLLIFANPLEGKQPDKDAPHVTYFGPGVHRPEGDKIVLQDDDTLYLAGGSVLQAGIEVRGENITIRGRGILDGTPWPWRKGPTGTTIDIQNSRNVTIEGIIVRGSPHWTIVPKNSDHVTVQNVKLCNSRVMNDDGINPCNSRHVHVRDCFIRSDDDCIALKGLVRDWGNVEDIRIENTVLWVDRARVTLLGHESRADYMRNIVYRNIDIIHAERLPFFLLEPGEEMRLTDVSFTDIRINGNGEPHLTVTRPTVNQYMRKKVPGHISNIRFENITVRGKSGGYKALVEGRDAQHKVENVTFDNVRIRGELLTKDSPKVKIGKWTENIRFTGEK